MGRIMGYCDRWSVAPGDTVRFMVSCLEAPTYSAQVVRLKQPDAGPEATPFAPEPVAAPCNGPHQGRVQAIPIGSLAVVPGHPVLQQASSMTLVAHVWPTTPGRGRQAIMGTWCEATRTGCGLELDETGALVLRVGTAAGVTVLSSGTRLLAEHWYHVAATYDATDGVLTLSQTLVAGNRFHAEQPKRVMAQAAPSPLASPPLQAQLGAPFTFAAWQNGKADGPSCWGGLAFGQHFNGKIDQPWVASRALDAAAIAGGGEADEALVARWDFSLDMGGDTIRDLGPNRLHGVIVNQPTRAMRGHNWTGAFTDWRQAPSEYGAIHFHDDDLVDACWDTDFTYTIPDGLRSGVYAVRLDSDGFDFWIPFFVRPVRGTATSKVAFLASTATYTVYMNNVGRFLTLATERAQGRLMFMDAIDEMLVSTPAMGLSTYDRHADGSGVAYSSRLRPVQNVRPTGRHWNFNLDLFIIDWLEHLGGDYDVITEEDLHREGLDLLRPYQVVLTGSHPEYDSVEMLDAMQAYLRQGGRLMYMGGNGFYWRIAHHPTRDGVIEVRRADAAVRAWDALPGEHHHSFSGEHGGTWRANARAPQHIAGVGFISQGFDHCSYYRRRPEAADPRAAWMFAGVEDALIGDFGILQGGAAGLEIDSADVRLGTPAHALVVARSENHSNTYEIVPEELLIPHGATDAIINPDIHADMTFFETPNGGAVWSTGSIAYAGSLGWNGFDNAVFRVTTNVLRRFVDPAPFALPG
jgi:N,N-dimethylformamidase